MSADAVTSNIGLGMKFGVEGSKVMLVALCLLQNSD